MGKHSELKRNFGRILQNFKEKFAKIIHLIENSAKIIW